VAHASIDHLRPARGRPVAHAIAIGAEIGAALDYLAGHSELRLPPVIAGLHDAAPGITRNAAGLVDLVGVPIGIPVGGPVPDVAGHVVEAVRVWWEGADRHRGAVTVIRSPGKVTVPEIGQPLARRLWLITPYEDHLIAAATCRGLPLGLGRQAAPSPIRVRFGILVADVHHRMIFAATDRRAATFGVAPARAWSPGPPQIDMPKIDRPGRTGEHH
jgi:hypothetical protein